VIPPKPRSYSFSLFLGVLFIYLINLFYFLFFLGMLKSGFPFVCAFCLFGFRHKRLLCGRRLLSEAAEGLLPEEPTAAPAGRTVLQSRHPKVQTNREAERSADCGFQGIAGRE